jgi:hypothetical protein
VVHESLALEPLTDAHLDQQVDGALLEHAGAHPVLDVLARAVLEHDGLDALELEQLPEHQAGGPGPDDPRPACASLPRPPLGMGKNIRRIPP